VWNISGCQRGRLLLAEAALYVACAPKSNSVYKGIGQALRDLEKGDLGEVPKHLRDTSYYGAKSLGHGEGYLYPHHYKGNYVPSSIYPILCRDVNTMNRLNPEGKSISRLSLKHYKRRKHKIS